MHKHSEFSGNELLSKAAEHLQKNGERWTALRKAILQTLIQFDTPASAYDITERASTLRGKKIAANSVYRILELFVTHNIASRVEKRELLYRQSTSRMRA